VLLKVVEQPFGRLLIEAGPDPGEKSGRIVAWKNNCSTTMRH
jgi:hypothetical protein